MALISCGSCGAQISSRARTCPKCGAEQQPSPPAADAGAPVSLPVRDQAVPPLPPIPVEDWYYVAASGRGGPVEFAVLRRLVAEGQFSPDTPVWKAGMPDWVKFSEYREEASDAGCLPQPEAVTVRNLYIWAVAFAPVWGGVLQIVATELKVAVTNRHLAYYSELWWVTVLLNVLVCGLDYRSFQKSGHDLRSLDRWLCLLVPVYIYRRDAIAGAKVTRLCIWMASCALAIALFVFLNGIYSQISTK